MMKDNQQLLTQIRNFLDYLQKEDFNSEKRQKLRLRYGKNTPFQERVIDLCIKSNYISETGDISDGEYQITTEGLKFLEEREERKIQKKQINAQNFLTMGILIFAIFSGVLTMIYYYINLKTKTIPQIYPLTFGIVGVIMLITISIGIIKTCPKKE